MLGYFPKPYKDELYYSILARYHYQTGNLFKSQTLQDLIGKYRKINYVFPFGLHQLVSRLKHFSEQYSVDYFVSNHTAIPLIKHFMDEENVNKLINMEGNLEKNNLFRYFVTRDGKVDSKEYLYYCSECLKEQFEIYGEGYWDRIHQIPGVFVCLKHRCILNRLKDHSLHEDEFILPKLIHIREHNEIYGNDVIDCLLNLAEDIKYLLEKDFESFSNGYYLQKYKTILKVKKIAFPVKQSQKKLMDLILDYYPFEFLELLNSSFQKTDKFTWLRYLNGDGKYIDRLHPIRHLLLMRLLCGSAKDFYEKEYTFEPYGKGPWICMNPLAEHYLKRVVTKVDISTHDYYRVLQGDMKCSCGFEYRLIGEEKSPLKVENFHLRILKRGFVWEQKFNEFIEQKLTLKEISNRTKLSVTTIKRILKKWEQEEIYRIKEEEKIRKRKEKTEGYKKTWLETKQKYPSLSRSELSSIISQEYKWLIKHEKEWMEENTPPTIIGKFPKVKQYSKEEDIKLLNKAKKVVLEWSKYEESKGKLLRMSKYKLLGLLGLREYSEKKFPLAIKYIYSNQELVIDFQKRRVRNVIDNKFIDTKVTVTPLC